MTFTKSLGCWRVSARGQVFFILRKTQEGKKSMNPITYQKQSKTKQKDKNKTDKTPVRNPKASVEEYEGFSELVSSSFSWRVERFKCSEERIGWERAFKFAPGLASHCLGKIMTCPRATETGIN